MRAVTRLIALALLSACGTDAPGRPRPAPERPADADQDGVASIAADGTDCDDLDPSVFPGAPETCDGRDENCDGVADEGFDCIAGAERPCGSDVGMVERCTSDCTWDPCTSATPLPDCPATSDGCAPGAREACATDCGAGSRTCTLGCTWAACAPPAEVCNGLDDDCDGEVDEGLWGLSSPLQPLEWTGWSQYVVSAAPTSSGLVGAFYIAGDDTDLSQAVVSWVDPSGQTPPAPVLVEAGATIPYEIDATPLEDRIAVAWDELSTLHLAVVSPEGVTAIWHAGPASQTELFWTGTELGAIVSAGMQLLRFDQDGAPTSEPLDFPAHIVSHAAWSGDAVVVPAVGAVLWVGLDGVVDHDLPLDDPQARPAVAAVREGVAIGYVADDTEVVFVLADGDGGEIATGREPAPASLGGAPLSLAPPVAIEEGFLLSSEFRGQAWRPEIVGWVVDPTGHTIGRPDYWLTAPTPRSWADWSVTSDGTSATLVHSLNGLSFATLGCRALP